jgi:hypothetical protein
MEIVKDGKMNTHPPTSTGGNNFDFAELACRTGLSNWLVELVCRSS